MRVDEISDEELETNDFADMASYAIENIDWIGVAIMLLLFILVSSDIFIYNILDAFPDLVKNGETTFLGVWVQGSIYVSAVIISRYLVSLFFD